MDFSNEIIKWYNVNKRDLPWRKTTNPYHIWLSEVILQQTRVDQGLPYYLNFITAYPTVYDLATAKEEEVLKLWQGLGYYSRARNLHKASQQVVTNYNGNFPQTKKELLNLKGIGEYTASAIASFCFKEKTAVVDGNVYRVLSRFFGILSPVDSGYGQKEFKEIAQQVLNSQTPDVHNQAIMEFGALQCTPKKPNCIACPLVQECYAFSNGKIIDLPFKAKKTKQRIRYFYYLVFDFNDKTYLTKRGAKDIWENLYEFPMIEKEKEEELTLITKDLKTLEPNSYTLTNSFKSVKHILSHQIIHSTFINLKITKSLQNKTWLKVKKRDIHNYPTHRLMEKFLKTNFD